MRRKKVKNTFLEQWVPAYLQVWEICFCYPAGIEPYLWRPSDVKRVFMGQKRTASTSWTEQLKSQSLDRTGHCQLLPHLHRLRISHSDECPCGTGPQPPNHILQSCPTFDALRCQTWPSPVEAHRKLWGPVETLRQTADFALLTGLKI